METSSLRNIDASIEPITAAEKAYVEVSLAPLPSADSIVITCYENEVPSFVEAELERLYGHIFSSMLQFRTYEWLDAGTSTYVAHRNGEIVTVFLYRRMNRTVYVLNQSIKIDNEDVQRFASHLFASDRLVNMVSFHAVRAASAEIDHLSFPHQRFNCSDDIVLALPNTASEYLASLGKNTRRNIKRYMERLQRSFPSFQCGFREKEAIDESQVRAIIGFNRARMAGKNKQSTLDDIEEKRIITLAKSCGLVSTATIEGRVCAGGIAYRIGDNYFLYVIAHDPAYDDYWIGILTCYLTICECIARGGKNFHFLWGRYDYKFTLGATLHHLDHIDVYRSRVRYLLNAHRIGKIALDRTLYDIKFGLLDAARRRDSLASRVVYEIINQLRKAKRFADGLLRPPANTR